MAKLSAYKQLEIVRVSRDFPGDGSLTVKERKAIAIMDNGRVLEKLTVWFKPSTFEPEARKHDYGWKLRSKVGHASLAKIGAWIAKLEARGWSVEHGPAWRHLPVLPEASNETQA